MVFCLFRIIPYPQEYQLFSIKQKLSHYFLDGCPRIGKLKIVVHDQREKIEFVAVIE